MTFYKHSQILEDHSPISKHRRYFSEHFLDVVKKFTAYGTVATTFFFAGYLTAKNELRPVNTLTEISQLVNEEPFLHEANTGLVGRIQNPGVGEVILPDYSGKEYETVGE